MSKWNVTNQQGGGKNGGKQNRRDEEQQQDDLVGQAIKEGYGYGGARASGSTAAGAQTGTSSAAQSSTKDPAQYRDKVVKPGQQQKQTSGAARQEEYRVHGYTAEQAEKDRKAHGAEHSWDYFSYKAAERDRQTPGRNSFERDSRLQSAVLDAASQRANEVWQGITGRADEIGKAANEKIGRATSQMDAALAKMNEAEKLYSDTGAQQYYDSYYSAYDEYEAAYQQYVQAVNAYNREFGSMQGDLDAYNQAVADANKAYGNLKQNQIEAPRQEQMPTRSELERTARGHRQLEQSARMDFEQASNRIGYDLTDEAAQEYQRQQQAYVEAVQDRARSEAALAEYDAMYEQYKMAQTEQQARSDPAFRDKVRTGRMKWEQAQAEATDAARRADKEAAFAQGIGRTGADVNLLNLYHLMEQNKAEAGVNTDLDTMFSPEGLTEAQQEVYFALFAEDPQKAAEYARYITQGLDAQYLQDLEEWSGRDPSTRLAALLAGSNLNLAAGLDPFGSAGQAATTLGQTMIGGGAKGLQERGIGNTGLFAGTIDEDVPIIGGKSLGDLYQLSSSMLQSAETAYFAAMTGGAGLAAAGVEGLSIASIGAFAGTALMGASAAAADYKEQLDKGVDQSTAVLHATAAGVAEALFEYVSLDKLVNQDVTASFLKNLLQQGGVEASEEVCTSIANRISDGLISHANGYNSAMDERIRELMEQGRSYDDAVARAQWDWVVEVINDGLGGFLSGGMMTAGNYASNLMIGGAANTLNDLRELSYYSQLQYDQDLQAYQQQVNELQEMFDAWTQGQGEDPSSASVPSAPSPQGEGMDGRPMTAPTGETESGRPMTAPTKESEGTVRPAGWNDRDWYVAHFGDAVDMSASYDSDGETVTSEIARIDEDGNAVLRNGETRSIDALQMDADTKDILQRLTRTVQGEEANAMLSLYRTAVSDGDVADGYATMAKALSIYENGRHNMSFEAAFRDNSLNREVARSIYNLGKQAAEQYAEVRQGLVDSKRGGFDVAGASGRRGSVDLSGIQWDSLTKTQKQQVSVISTYAKALGVDVEFFRSEVQNGRYVGENGSYVNGKIRIDVNAGANYVTDAANGMLKAMSHELTHFVEDYSPKLYSDLKGFAFEVLTEKYGQDRVNRMLDEKVSRSRDGLTREGAESELIADACEMLLSESETAAKLVAENRTLAQKIADWIQNFLAKVKELFGSTQRDEARAIMEKLEQVSKLWDAALAEAVQAHDEIGSMREIADDVSEVGASAQMAEEAAIQYSDRIDHETLDFLDNQEHVTVYRAMQLIDGKLYPPMAAKVEGKLVEPTEIGKWYQSVERPDLVKNGKFTLNKGNGTSVPAAYNPYFHCSASPLNDQFSSAYKRPNLVVVEGIIPKSELTSGYRAEGAKNSVGEAQWHAGPVASKLKGDKARRVFLSRYFQVSRIMTDTEVAKIVANTLQGENVSVPSNVVTPSLLEALKEQGVAVDESGIERFEGQHKKKNAQKGGDQYSERDYDTPSDVELLMGLSEEDAAKGEQRQMLQEFQAKERKIEGLQQRLESKEAEIAELKAQMRTTNRGLNTKGLSGVVKNMMTELGIGDANGKGVAKKAVQMLTDIYSDALAQIDQGEPGKAMQILGEGGQKLGAYLIDNGTYAEKFGYRWIKTDWSRRYANTEESRAQVLHDISADVTSDFIRNRYRDAIQPTAADRLVEQTARQYEGRLSTATAQLSETQAQNRKLSEQNEHLRAQRDSSWDYQSAMREQLETKQRQLDEARREARQQGKTAEKQSEKVQALQSRVSELTKELKAQTRTAEKAESRAQDAAHQVWLAGVEQRTAEFRSRLAKSKQESLQRRLNGQIRENEKIQRDLEKQIAREKDILAGKLKPLEMQRLLKAEREKASQAMRTKKEQQFADYRERQEASRLRGRIKNLADDIKRTMLHPTDGRYVPASLYEHMARLTDALALEPKDGTKAAERYRAVQEAIHKMAAEYAKLGNRETLRENFLYASEFDEDVMGEINEISERFSEKNIREMNSGELREIYDLVRSVNLAMKGATRMIGTTKNATVYEYGDSIIKNQQEVRARKQGKWLGNAFGTLNLDSLSPIRAVHMMGGFGDSALYELWKNIETGNNEKARVIMESNKRLQKLKTGVNETAYLKALQDQKDFGIEDIAGKPVRMTELQAIQLIMTWEREDHNDKLVHLQEGGAVIRDSRQNEQRVRFTPEMIDSLRKQMTDWDKQYMQAARDVFRSLFRQSSRVLYQLQHRTNLGEEFYIPERVDQQYLVRNIGEADQFNLMHYKEAGSTKPLQAKSTLPVYIDGLETVLNSHIQEMANYIGLAIPIRDFAKVYNLRTTGIGVDATTVNGEIQQTWGKKGNDMMLSAIRDIQNAKSNQYRTELDKVMQALQRFFVKSALVGRISVVFKQAASYAAAGSVLSQRALDSAQFRILPIFASPNSKMAQEIYARADALTPELYLRRMGMSMEEIAMERLRDGKINGKLNRAGAWLEGKGKGGQLLRRAIETLNPTDWIQRMDVATTTTLFVACEKQAKYDGFKRGTEEYEKHVRDLYERVIHETQPMYDPLHRPELQRNTLDFVKMMFPFKTVPFQNYGQIVDAFGMMQEAKRNGSKEQKKTAAKHLGKTIWANFESALVFSLITMIVQGGLLGHSKKYRDEDEEYTIESVLKGYAMDVLDVNISNALPYGGSELKDVIERVINGDKWYDVVSIGTVEHINDEIKAILSLFDEDADFNTWKSALLQTTKFFGLPITNILETVEGLNNAFNTAQKGQIPGFSNAEVERSASLNAGRLLKAWSAGDTEKQEAVFEEMVQNYMEGGKSREDAEKAAMEAIRGKVKEDYESGNLTRAEAETLLAGNGKTDDEAFWAVEEWERNKAHADDPEYKFSRYEDLDAAIDAGGDVSEASEFLTEHGVTQDAIKNHVMDHLKELYNTGEIDEQTAMDRLQEYRGLDENDAYWKVQEWDALNEHSDDKDYSFSKYNLLKETVTAGGDIADAVEELLSHGVEEKEVWSAVQSAVAKQWESGELSDEEAMEALQTYWRTKPEGGKTYEAATENDAWFALQKWTGERDHADDPDYEWNQYEHVREAIDANGDINDAVDALVSHGVKKSSVKTWVKSYIVEKFEEGEYSEQKLTEYLSRYLKITKKDDVNDILTAAKCHRDTGYSYDSIYDGSTYKNGGVSRDECERILVKYAGIAKDEARRWTTVWDFQNQHDELGWEKSTVYTYMYEDPQHSEGTAYAGKSAKDMGITPKVWDTYLTGLKDCVGEDKNGDGRADTGTKQKQIVALINSLPLTLEQKRFLWLRSYGKANLWKVK
jgi:hypothetical protein